MSSLGMRNVDRHSTLAPPETSSSVLENPVTFLPAKIDFPFLRAPTSALDEMSRSDMGESRTTTHAGP